MRGHTGGGTARVTRWWAGEYGLAGGLLRTMIAPVEAAYTAAIAARNAAYDRGWLRVTHVDVPVVSVGNLAVGGAGKTPVAAWLLDELCRRAQRPALLHGGYASDEPALHRRWHPDLLVLAGRDRVAAAAHAIAAGATALVLDDGFQHRRLGRDVDLVLIAAETWRSRRPLLPRGPWREPLHAARRATLLAVTRKTADGGRAAAVAAEVTRSTGKPAVCIALLPAGWRRADGAPSSAPHDAVAVAGIAEPTLFADSARAAGGAISQILAYGDHHEYSPADAAHITAVAAGRPIVTTEKDWIKLESLLDDRQVLVLPQRVEIENGAEYLAQALDGLFS